MTGSPRRSSSGSSPTGPVSAPRLGTRVAQGLGRDLATDAFKEATRAVEARANRA